MMKENDDFMLWANTRGDASKWLLVCSNVTKETAMKTADSLLASFGKDGLLNALYDLQDEILHIEGNEQFKKSCFNSVFTVPCRIINYILAPNNMRIEGIEKPI